MAVSHHATIFTKLLKLLINIVVVVLYRNGDDGWFMGATFNESRDAEALACGVMIGFLIYNIISLVSTFADRESLDSTILDTVMNVHGAGLWIIFGGITMQHWLRFVPGNHSQTQNPSAPGIAMGMLAVINSAVYFADTFISYKNYNSSARKGY